MQTLSQRTRILIIIIVAFITALAFVYYVVFPGWIKQKVDDLSTEIKEPFTISVEKIHATAWPFGLGLKNVSIHQLSSDSTITDSLFVEDISIQGFNPVSFLLHGKYSISHITLDHLTGQWSLPADDTSKAEIISPFHSSFETLSFKNVNFTLKKKDSSRETKLENGNLRLKNIELNKDSLLSSITYHISEIKTTSVHHVSSDSLYSFRGNSVFYTDKDSSLHVDSFFSTPNLEKYAFARMQPYQTDQVTAEFKNITIRQFDLNALIFTGDIRMSSFHADSFLLDIFRDRRRPFLHKIRPLYQDLLHNYPGVLAIDSILAINGKIIYTEHDVNASEPGIIWFSDVSASMKHLYNDTSTIQKPHDTLIIAAQALAMGKGRIQFESKGHLRDPQNRFVFTGHMEDIPVTSFNPILVPNAAIEASDGFVHGIYFNFSADNTSAQGDLIFRYEDLKLLKIDKETSRSKGLKNRLLTRVLNRKILDHNPLPDDVLRTGTIDFERDPEKMYFSYMLKSIFSGIRESVMK